MNRQGARLGIFLAKPPHQKLFFAPIYIYYTRLLPRRYA